MERVKIFENAEFGQMRTVTIDDEPWFVGKDVAEALGYAKARSSLNSFSGISVATFFILLTSLNLQFISPILLDTGTAMPSIKKGVCP